MAGRVQNTIRHLASRSTFRIVDGRQPEEETTRARGAGNKQRRSIKSSSQSQLIRHVRRQRQPYRSARINATSADMIPIQVDSDSDPEPIEAENDGADGVAESQNLDHHAPPSSPATSSLPKETSGSGLRRKCSTVASEPIETVITATDMMHCSICHDPLSTPIFLCADGHTSCSYCKIRTNDKCPSCRVPNSFTHCCGMEKLIGSMEVECENRFFGCGEKMTYFQMKSEHENKCLYTLCSCPISSCNSTISCNFTHTSKHLYDHFRRCHLFFCVTFLYNKVFHLSVERTQKRLVLREQDEGALFIVNHEVIEGDERVFSVDCIGPGAFKGAFVYQLSVKCMKTCFSMESVPGVFSKWEEHTLSDYLAIPSGYPDFQLQVCIKKA